MPVQENPSASMAAATSTPTAPPLAAAPSEEVAGATDQEQRLMTGWVNLKSGSKTRRLWMAVTDVSLTAEDEKGGNKARATAHSQHALYASV